MEPNGNELSLFNANVFTDEVMRQQLPPEIYSALKRTTDEGSRLTIDVAEAVAQAMKDWAQQQGATHFTHWFQPMTGSTAEKLDSFLYIPGLGAKPLFSFSGKALIRGEADGSSFPSGGLRPTFEARGYTTWDCTSPAFVRDDGHGVKALCIPTAFCAFSGEALDEKTPLLRSMDAVNKQAVRLLHLLGRTDVKKVTPTVGGEQEYFLVDKEHFKQRKDLVYTGRTLFGAPPAKGQELGDQYYARTPERVAAFMHELDIELWKLGVPAKTQHNEAAPSQYELAPLFASSNVACDHNQIIMEQMRKSAEHHGFVCLLHEKPFAGVNGSGKHNNWSLCTDTGENLLKAHKQPQEIFMTFFIAVISAVDEYARAMRMACTTLGNEHRLGGHEAPPAIISIFTGSKIHHDLVAYARGENEGSYRREEMDIGVSTMATLRKDDTDRNRTSPFAFTGDKFEFRMVGSSQSLGTPNTVLNTIVAEMLMRISDELEKHEDKKAALKQVLSDMLSKHERVIFNGNNYSDEWVAEAKRRGLPNVSDTVDAINIMCEPEVVSVFSRHNVFSEGELSARRGVGLTNYLKTGRIEALTMLKMSRQKILPACVRYCGELARSANEMGKAHVTATGVHAMLNKLSVNIDEYCAAIEELSAALADIPTDCAEDDDSCAHAFRNNVQPAMAKVRLCADKLERIVDKKHWPLPSYGEMLFHIV